MQRGFGDFIYQFEIFLCKEAKISFEAPHISLHRKFSTKIQVIK